MGTYRTYLDANRSAVRAPGAAHSCPQPGGFDPRSPRTEGIELPFVMEPPVE